MNPSDADELSGIRRRASHMLDRVASVLPTVRARLFALVLVALVPALVILVYDEWRARERGFAALTDLSTRVVRLLQREMEDRITRGAHRLSVLAEDPDVVALSPAAHAQAGRCAARGSPVQQPVDRRRHDRRRAGERRAAGSQGQRARARSCSSVPAARSTSRPGPFFPNRPPTNLVSISRNPS